ncbi:MAG TPA: alginate lyase family protein [Aggregicoccus sp.]|nr:alginate lyase family protein [Aggregicoccus sp.]
MGTLGYYTTIARLAPGALARVAARRVQGVARQALYRRREPTDELSLLRAYGVQHADALPQRVLGVRPGAAWCEVDQRAAVLEALAQLPGAEARALARARAALEQRFDVFGTPVCFGEGRPVDWGLDVLSGYRYPVQPVESLTLLRAGVDPKFPWVLGRLDSALALAQGYWVQREPAERSRYARAFVAQTLDFLAANPVGQGVHWTCAMEIALRAANLAQALAMFADAPEVRAPAFTLAVLGALSDHAAYVEAHLEDRSAVPNNHLLSNYVGLLVVGLLFPELPGAARQVALAREGLAREVLEQVHPDGLSFEGSVPYHRLGVELLTLAQLVARGAGVSLGEAYEARLRGMYAASRALCSQAGLAPQIGDNDSGRVLTLCDRESLDHGYLAPLGAALFDEPSLAGGAFPDEAAWLLGAAGLERYRRMPHAPEPSSRVFADGGLQVLRGAGAVVTVSAGTQGQRGVGGHNHNDKLSFELHLDGVPVIVDPGSPTYTRDGAQRNAFRSTAAHNTLEVDGQEQSPLDPQRLFALPEAARARVVVFQPGAQLDRLVVRHDGYRFLPAPVGVQRSFALDKRERALSVCDALTGVGLHEVVGRIHLADDSARLRAPTAQECARALGVPQAPETFSPVAVELGPEGRPHAVLLFEAGLTPELLPARYSPGYGQSREALAVVFRGRVAPPGWLRWVVVFR